MAIAAPDRALEQLRRASGQLAAGRPDRARGIAEAILERHPDHLAALRIAGHAALGQGVVDRAFDVLLAAATQDPTHVTTLDALAVAAEETGRPAVAQEALERAVAVDASDPTRYLRLGTIHLVRGQLEEAHGYLLLAARFAPEDPAAHRTLGDALIHLDRPDDAAAAYERAVALDPERGVNHVALAGALEALGRVDEADEHRRQALVLEPTDVGVAFGAKGARRFRTGDPVMEALERAVQRDELPVAERVPARLALVKMYDDAGALERAATHLRRANEQQYATLVRRGRAYDAGRAAAIGNAVVASFDAGIARHGPPPARPGSRQLLIGGLPRAGKSLLEHLLGQHPDVVALGEADHLHRARRTVEQRTGEPFPRVLAGLSPHQRDDLHTAIADETAREARVATVTAPTSVVANAHPANRWHVALSALSDARTMLVSCERDPRDVLLANLMQWFPTGQPQSYRIEDLIRAWELEQDLTEQWAERLATPVLRVRYDRLVTSPAAETGRVLDALGLPWSDGCAGRPASTDALVTAAVTDKPDPARGLHTHHLGEWQRWAPHLPELFDAIEQAGLVERFEVMTS